MILAERPDLRLKDDVPRRPAYFWWFLANALALCFAVVSWLACLEVFGNPEIPRNYEILRKIGRQPTLKAYPAENLPDGIKLDASGLYSRFYPMDAARLMKFNSALMRNYLTNFDRSEVIVHVEGGYKIEKVRKLTENDFITQGVLLRARAMVSPDAGMEPAPYPVAIDCILPTSESDASQKFRMGDMLRLGEQGSKVTLLNVSKVGKGADAMQCFSVIPLVKGVFRIDDEKVVAIEPPESLRLSSAFPLMR